MQQWAAEKAALRSDVAAKGTCGKCQAPVLKALAGAVAALHVEADPEPLDHRSEAEARRQGRLTWCLAGSLTKRIQWRHYKCSGHPVLAEHVCQSELVRMVTLADAVREHDRCRGTR